jgi:hypothetical protein
VTAASAQLLVGQRRCRNHREPDDAVAERRRLQLATSRPRRHVDREHSAQLNARGSAAGRALEKTGAKAANAPELSGGADCELLNQTACNRRRLQLLVRPQSVNAKQRNCRVDTACSGILLNDVTGVQGHARGLRRSVETLHERSASSPVRSGRHVPSSCPEEGRGEKQVDDSEHLCHWTSSTE